MIFQRCFSFMYKVSIYLVWIASRWNSIAKNAYFQKLHKLHVNFPLKKAENTIFNENEEINAVKKWFHNYNK